MIDLSIGGIVILGAAILAGGAASGLLAGLFGIGGSSIVIPVLYELFRVLGVPDEVRMQLCIGTALAITIPTTYRAYRAHRVAQAVLTDALRIWALPAMAGVGIGTLIAYVAPGTLFKVIFILFALFMATRFLLGRESWRIADRLPGTPTMMAAGVGFGCLATLVGVAGGSFSTLFLTLYGQPFHAAVATSSGIGVYIAIPATIGYMLAGWPQQALMPPLSIGFVSFLGILLFAPASVLAAPYGARLAHRLPKRNLEIAFSVFLIVVAIRFFVSLF